jgi:hypothetical protein
MLVGEAGSKAGCCLGDVAADDNAADDKGVEVVEDCPLLDSRVEVVNDDQILMASGVRSRRSRDHDPPLGQVNLDLGFGVWGLGFRD